jgi:hypothetical protein
MNRFFDDRQKDFTGICCYYMAWNQTNTTKVHLLWYSSTMSLRATPRQLKTNAGLKKNLLQSRKTPQN